MNALREPDDHIRLGPETPGIERLDVRLAQRAFAPHRHDTYAIGITLAGVQCFHIRGRRWHCLPGQCHVLHPDEMTIFGWVLLPVMAAVFLVPAWIILVGRKHTRLDATRREATEAFDLLVYTRRRTTAVPRDAPFLHVTGKGGQQRMVPVSARARAALSRWLAVRRGQSKFLFPSSGASGHLTRVRLFQLLRELACRSGV